MRRNKKVGPTRPLLNHQPPTTISRIRVHSFIHSSIHLFIHLLYNTPLTFTRRSGIKRMTPRTPPRRRTIRKIITHLTILTVKATVSCWNRRAGIVWSGFCNGYGRVSNFRFLFERVHFVILGNCYFFLCVYCLCLLFVLLFLFRLF
jgi:hypothetical protein